MDLLDNFFGDPDGPSKTDQTGQDHFQLGLAIGRQYHEAIKARVAAHAPWKTKEAMDRTLKIFGEVR